MSHVADLPDAEEDEEERDEHGVPLTRTVRIPAWLALILVSLAATRAAGAEPFFRSVAIFPAESKHNHASCVIETANGDLLTAWYRGSGERTADDVEIRVWDSSAAIRYLVLPQRPVGTEAMTEDELAALVTRDAMIGVRLATV